MPLTSSKYIQLQNVAGDALLEYIYNSDVISTEDVNFLRIKNLFTRQLSYVNYSPEDFVTPLQKTSNVLDNNVQQIDDAKWVHLDVDRPIKYFEQTVVGSNGKKILQFEKLHNEITDEVLITYDTVRLHILSGFTFPNSAGVIIQVAYLDRTGSNPLIVANYAYLKENDNIHFNSRVLNLGDRNYNRYIEFKVPSLSGLTNTNEQILNKFSVTGDGFIKSFPNFREANIVLLIHDINKIENARDGQLYLYTTPPSVRDSRGRIQVDIPQEDTYASLAAVIQSSDSGDFFEFYPTYNGEFIEDFVADRQRLGESILAVHDLDIYEHVLLAGKVTDIRTDSFTSLQETDFDTPHYYRPIVHNNKAAAFTIEYTLRILNKNDNSQIIRKSTLTSKDARKYGRSLKKINLSESPQVHKIVNKISITNPTSTQQNNISPFLIQLGQGGTVGENGQTTKLEPTIIEKVLPISVTNVAASATSLFINDVNEILLTSDPNDPNGINSISQATLQDVLKSDIIYGQGEAVIWLHPFDNFLKFSFYKIENESVTLKQKVTLSTDYIPTTTFRMYLTFKLDNGEILQFEALDSAIEFPTVLNPGELIFKVDQQSINTILRNKNRNFYITGQNTLKDAIRGTDAKNSRKQHEVPIYMGKFDSFDNFERINHINYELKERMLEERLQQINSKQIVLNKIFNDVDRLMSNVNTSELNTAQQALLDELSREVANLRDEAGDDV